jgi:hypothetical protein
VNAFCSLGLRRKLESLMMKKHQCTKQWLVVILEAVSEVLPTLARMAEHMYALKEPTVKRIKLPSL